MNRRDFGRASLLGLAGFSFPRASAAQAAGAYRYIHLDVFTDRRMQGNQLFVFTQPAGLDTETMQTMTRESNLSECTFVFPPEQAGTDHRVRIFTRTAETPFAGHPTIGTAFALAHAGVLKPGAARTIFGLGVGPTNLDLEWKDGKLAFAWMTQQKPTFGKTVADAAALGGAIGLDAASIDTRAPAQEVYSGSTFFIVPLTTRKAVDSAVLDRAKVDAMFAAAGAQRRGIYVFSTEQIGDGVSAYSRMLPAGGIEDPATGSAVGPAGCFAAKYGFVPRDRVNAMIFLQGVFAKRPSRLHVRALMTGADVTGVQVGGSSVVVGEGTMSV
jgi:trans-2,3-dihydro-3-hydroxyanthranilate isomerase